MERLTKRDKNGNALPAKSSTSSYIGTIYEEEKGLEQERLNRLAELEDKIDSGELVDLTELKTYQLSVGCKGTSSENYFIDEITPILIETGGKWNLEYKNRLCAEPKCDRGGRTLIGYFLTKSKAEAHLKELQEKRQ